MLARALVLTFSSVAVVGLCVSENTDCNGWWRLDPETAEILCYCLPVWCDVESEVDCKMYTGTSIGGWAVAWCRCDSEDYPFYDQWNACVAFFQWPGETEVPLNQQGVPVNPDGVACVRIDCPSPNECEWDETFPEEPPNHHKLPCECKAP